MTKATTTMQKHMSDRPAEFKAAQDAYILGYRRHHSSLRQSTKARATRVSIFRFIQAARSWVLVLGQL
jgi:hypothetical protein